MKTVAIIVDNPKRDLMACMLIAKDLVRLGFRVYLTPMLFLQNFVFKHPIDYVLFNYCRKNNASLIQRILKSGRLVGILDTEGGVFTKVPPSNEIDFFNNLYTNKYISERLTNYFVWGEEVYRELTRKKLFPADRVFLTGTPRTDLFVDSRRAIYGSVVQRYILVNFSFSLINPKFNSFEREFDHMVASFNFDPIYLRKIVDQQRVAQIEFIKAVKFLSGRFPNRLIKVRAHPFEDEKVYLGEFVSCSNVVVSNTESIEAAILSASLVLHFESSTSLEAACLGVPAISPLLEPSLRPIHQAEKVTQYYSDLNHLADMVEADIRWISPQIEEVVSEVFYRVDGESSKRISEIIAKSISCGVVINKALSFLFHVLSISKFRIKKLLGKSDIHSDKKISISLVRELDEKLSAIGFDRCSVRVIYDHVIEVGR